ncbi:MAG TPA: hypothetical protein VGV37_02465 [Aliidongia sp.]|uniref:hypothetical protein n=1 Tax=Aliidongia sp. TaxID=1914230 RepID=UPI002DDD792B|nr:hypothetical protein [Aliidongia sp.]HEV2673374.1 hypothetical protein [Aliidongia sp.]
MSEPSMSLPSPTPPLTPEQILVLSRFADHVSAGRKAAVFLFKAMAALGGLAGALAAFLYFSIEVVRDWPWGVK